MDNFVLGKTIITVIGPVLMTIVSLRYVRHRTIITVIGYVLSFSTAINQNHLLLKRGKLQLIIILIILWLVYFRDGLDR
jgi:hypothetical protein